MANTVGSNMAQCGVTLGASKLLWGDPLTGLEIFDYEDSAALK